MQVLNAGFDLPRFSESVRRAPLRALLLDYDGTLAPFDPDRHRASVYPSVAHALRGVARDGRTRLAVVSGRSVLDLESRMAPFGPLELWGSHGLEHRSGSASPASPPPSGNEDFLAREAAWIADRGWNKVLERKPFGLALHGRAFPAAFHMARRAVLPRWSAAADERGLEIRPFDGGVELRPRGAHKGQVVERVLEDVGPHTPVAYLGDDATDEDAFEAIRGRGLGVLVRHELRPTLADAWIRPPVGVAEFLVAWSAVDGGALA